jgi:predicted dehydrogenase
MSVNPLRVLIVGCGNIGGTFDQVRLPADSPLTHAGAFSQDARFTIAACVEPDNERRDKFMKTWNVPLGFSSLSELIDLDEQFDIISLCSPTACHINDLEIALGLKPKLIFCEKPLTKFLSESVRLVEECSKFNIPLAVNHTRRWDPDISKLQKDINAGLWGQLRSVNGIYNKGILNNGSHMLDLLHLIVGPLVIVKVGRPVQDFFSDDPSIPVWLEGHQGLQIHLACGNAEDYSLFELQFVFSEGVLTMEQGGMFWRERRAIDSVTFKGYRDLDDGVRRPGASLNSMLKAVDNIYHVINQSETLACTGKSALVAQRLCEQIKDLACRHL